MRRNKLNLTKTHYKEIANYMMTKHTRNFDEIQQWFGAQHHEYTGTLPRQLIAHICNPFTYQYADNILSDLLEEGFYETYLFPVNNKHIPDNVYGHQYLILAYMFCEGFYRPENADFKAHQCFYYPCKLTQKVALKTNISTRNRLKYNQGQIVNYRYFFLSKIDDINNYFDVSQIDKILIQYKEQVNYIIKKYNLSFKFEDCIYNKNLLSQPENLNNETIKTSDIKYPYIESLDITVTSKNQLIDKECIEEIRQILNKFGYEYNLRLSKQSFKNKII